MAEEIYFTSKEIKNSEGTLYETIPLRSEEFWDKNGNEINHYDPRGNFVEEVA